MPVHRSWTPLLPLLSALLFSGRAAAQSSSYTPITSVAGVEIAWSTTLAPYAAKYTALLRLSNLTSGRKEVHVTPIFICADGTVRRPSGQMDTLQPYAAKGGELAGWWFLPCAERVRITALRLELRVVDL